MDKNVSSSTPYNYSMLTISIEQNNVQAMQKYRTTNLDFFTKALKEL